MSSNKTPSIVAPPTQMLKKKKRTENDIGAEGACVLSEALKANTTLTTLHINCERQSHKKRQSSKQHQYKTNETASNISAEGVRALSDALNVNTTLATLDIG